MGAGKSTVGPILAERLGRPFVDLDARVEQEHGPIPALLAGGEERFRRIERATLAGVPDGCVLATGGGAYVQPATRADLERRFLTVWLDVDLPTARRRISDDGSRPLLKQPGLLDRRRPHYRAASVGVDATGHVERVVEDVLAAIQEPWETIQDYQVRFTDDPSQALADLDEPIVVADARVWDLHGDRLGSVARVYTFPPERKSVATWVDLQDRILADGARRDQTIVAFGGGVAGDLAGFCAATLLRGVRWRLIPTTTLAMVDSSVGGKTGVDHPRGKNLIGAFHRPSGVWVDRSLLATLPSRDVNAGLAEAVKVGLVAAAPLFELLEHTRVDDDLMEHVIRQAVRAKGAVVSADERESGLRRILNAGHTVGHALEAALGYGTLRHGEAVAIGLVLETAFAEREGICEAGTSDRIRAVLDGLGLPTSAPPFDRREALAAMRLDKKATRDRVSLPLVVSPGRARGYDLPTERLSELLPA